MQNKKARVQYGLSVSWHCINIINGIVKTGSGIQVLSEFHTNSFQIRNYSFSFAVIREIFGTVKSHMFQEVSQTTLILFFLHGTHFLYNVEVSLIFR